jgi:hypothetical protein
MRSERKIAGLLIALTMWTLPSGPSLAQAIGTTTMPAIGATSPLSTLGSPTLGPVPNPVSPTGIPLGALEINPGGLSTPSATSSGMLMPQVLGTVTASGSVGSTGCINTLAPGPMVASTGIVGATSPLTGFGAAGRTGGTVSTTVSSSANQILSTELNSCATGTSSSLMTATTPTTVGSSSRIGTPIGIPLGSLGIANLGVSPITPLTTPLIVDPVTSPALVVPQNSFVGTCGLAHPTPGTSTTNPDIPGLSVMGTSRGVASTTSAAGISIGGTLSPAC